MKWELVKPWVNRVGIMLEFLSFWFAAPEVLGEKWLLALEGRIERGLEALRLRATCGFVVPLLPLMWLGAKALLLWERRKPPAKRQPLARVLGLSDEVPQPEAILVPIGFVGLLALALPPLLCFAVLTLVGAVGLLPVNWRLTLKWTLAVFALVLTIMGGVAVLVLLTRAARPLLRALADDERIRQRSLAVGAVLFVVGFLLQLIATF
jgi:hypothetical protein